MIFDSGKYAGRPFEYGGRGPEKYDCYGLVKAIYMDNGIDLPEYVSVEDRGLIQRMIFDGKRLFEEIDRPEPLSVVALAIHPKFVSHIGVIVPDGRFVHITKNSGVTVERLDSITWARRLRGFYKWTG